MQNYGHFEEVQLEPYPPDLSDDAEKATRPTNNGIVEVTGSIPVGSTS